MDGNFSIQDIQEFILKWNNDYPIDRYWRKKYSIPFNSEQHRKMSLLDMRIDFEEDRLFDKSNEEKEERSVYIAGTNNYLRKKNRFVKVSDKEAEDLFNQIDISQFNQSDGKEIILK